MSYASKAARPAPIQQFAIRTRLAESDPIVSCTNLFDWGYEPAHVMLDEPLCRREEEEEELGADVTSVGCICAQMSILIDKEAQLLYMQLQKECGQLFPSLSLRDALDQLRMLELFPSLAERLQLEPSSDKSVTFKEYINHIALLHQTLAMASQIRADLSSSNHKYMAHQIALLYQSLSYGNMKGANFKAQIEEQFPAIKKVTEESQAPQLSKEHCDWLRSITTQIIESCTDLTAPSSQYIQPWMVVFSDT
ncbi:hypothetical protein GUITHDRAFT_116178 [Guillardia theta CCMP2712]|uniref:Uncharacterized protein n=1 Tax=Guillardia theta (strain CCMP2712) TaxID=905079 RepID=L1INQ6_GUITC|nr:hypothetical protein GUITHDRAFT_116178 [Guillardia theta CCMP2712]EKX37702.1 hypothetical protein GUITHDRAFT_116178 [Guillardia theta CCMP2712]|eukprot:XP_005824682.1 hypothetical protein GUITHDRAFT_116178 [Guillardia theta CCMP2712]